MSNIGWYIDNGDSEYMTYDRIIFNKFQEQEGGMRLELGDDVTYLMKGMGSIIFQMPSIDVLELNDVLFVSCPPLLSFFAINTSIW